MSESAKIIEPTETIQLPAPSWAPAVLAFGILGLLAGVFATGFFIPAWWFAVLGAALVLLSLRSLVRRGTRSYYSLPRTQDDVRAELPVESFGPPSKN